MTGAIFPIINTIAPMIAAYKTMIARVRGNLALTRRLTNGFNKKYRKPEMIIGKNNVDANTTIGSKRKEILVET